MKKLILISVFGLLPMGCATTNKAPVPSCGENICYSSNPTGRIKNVIYGKGKQSLLVKDITWVPTVVTKSHVSQGHLELELMAAEVEAK